MIKKGFPSIHFYDQDFVDLYDKTWAWIEDCWAQGNDDNGFVKEFFQMPGEETVHQFDSCLSTFFLVYSNKIYPVEPILDNFYSKQEDSGAIRGEYRISDGRPVFTDDNPEGIHPPLFAWAEHNLYHRVGNKKRLKEIVPNLEKHFLWLESICKDEETGLYRVPLSACQMGNSPRGETVYPVDFNSAVAVNALYLSEIGDILNDKDLSFRYKRLYFSLKTRINSKMWDDETGFYYDLNENLDQVKNKTLATYWTMVAEIPNEDRAKRLVDHLRDSQSFGTEHPFPSLAADHPEFDVSGGEFKGSVFPFLNFIVIKGLEKYEQYGLARECAIRHFYFMLDTLHPEGKKGDVYEAYNPLQDGPARGDSDSFPRKRYFPHIGLTSITLMIENIIGLYISLPRKTVDWLVPTLEIMGIEDLSLKRNMITILSNKSGRGWEIRLESEKLYYFTIDILNEGKRKTLPIPSGKCSMLIDKL